MKKIISLWIFTTYFLIAQSPNFDSNIEISTLIDTTQVKIGEEINFKGKLDLFLGKKEAPYLDINSIKLFMLLLFKDLSPSIFTSMFGVVDKTPIKSLAKVPELPKFKRLFFFICRDPIPVPYTT